MAGGGGHHHDRIIGKVVRRMSQSDNSSEFGDLAASDARLESSAACDPMRTRCHRAGVALYPLLRPLAFALDAERAHRATIAALKLLPAGRPAATDPDRWR